MMINQFLSESNEALGRVSKYQSQVDSTKRITGIADDPQGTLTALRARNKLSNLELYKANISTASSYLKEAESATSELNEILQHAYEDVLSAQGGSKSQTDLDTLAEDLKNLQDEVLSISNSSMGTSYIFGGYNYTGSVTGGVKKPPFTVNDVTGDISYNGVNLSQFSWNDEFAGHTTLMSQGAVKITDIAAAFSTGSTDAYNKSQAESAAAALDGLLANAKRAMNDAVEFGIDPSSASYTGFESFYNDLKTASDALNTEVSKGLAGDYILDTDPTIIKTTGGAIDYDYYQSRGISVYTASELSNKFNSTATQTALNNVASFLSGTPSSLDTAVTDLRTDIDAVITAAQPAMTAEEGKTTTLQIGTSQNVDITLTGLDLLGTGAGNIYHAIGKAIKALSSGATDELPAFLTSLQNAQSSVMTLGTRIGASQNRLTLISNRYDSSQSNYTQMRSNAEDADMAEAIMSLTTAQTVYNAALAGGSEIIKTSLIDFLR
jgi:flagellar hook-associated protein 3